MALKFTIKNDAENRRLQLVVVDDADGSEKPQYGKVTLGLDDVAFADLATVGEIKLRKVKICDTSTNKQRTMYLLGGVIFKDTDDPA